MIGYVAKDSINGRGMCKTIHPKNILNTVNSCLVCAPL